MQCASAMDSLLSDHGKRNTQQTVRVATPWGMGKDLGMCCRGYAFWDQPKDSVQRHTYTSNCHTRTPEARTHAHT